jgi:hypothetical protein
MSLLITGEAGTITVPDGVLVAIAVRAAEGVDGIRVRRRRAINLDAGVVRLTVAARREEPLVELGERTQEAVAAALKAACGLAVTVDLVIGELL